MKTVKVFKHFETPKEHGVYHRLICLTGEKKGDAYFIIGNRVVLGRSEKADIKVLDIKSSREHAEITKVGDDLIITDLGSQNGVVVNDLKIKQRSLKNGDKIIIGKTVYKYSEVVVDAPTQIIEEDNDEDNDEEDNEIGPKKKGNTLLILVAIGGLLLLFMPNEKVQNKKQDSSKYDVKEISDPFTSSITNKKNKENKESKEKMNIYFQKGLREFRENNYFRAINEFNHALSWTPGDPLAEFYLRKTKEALDKSIETYFIEATRNIEALKFQKAVVQYCAIIRLLFNYPEDERYKNAQEGIKSMEGKLGLDEGDIKCADVIQ